MRKDFFMEIKINFVEENKNDSPKEIRADDSIEKINFVKKATLEAE